MYLSKTFNKLKLGFRTQHFSNIHLSAEVIQRIFELVSSGIARFYVY